jgi:hypothetical protein
MMGSTQTCTPFRYEINYRNFLLLTEGSAQIKLAPPHSTKYLYPIYDYENFEFKSPVNPWNPQPKYSADFEKIKCLEFNLTPGKTLFIPAYWWYTIKFSKNTSISCFNYRTYMNNIAVLPYIGMHALQIQNVQRNVYKKVSITELNDGGQNERGQNDGVHNELRHNELITPIDSDNNENNDNPIDSGSGTNIDNLPESNNID